MADIAVNDTLERIARKYEPKMSAAMIRAFNILRNQNTTAEIEALLLQGGVDAVMRTLENTPAVISSQLLPEIDDAILESGRATVALVPSQALLDETYRFATLNPQTADFIRRYELNLIREVSQETIAGVRQGLADDIITGRNPRVTAREFRANIGLTQKQEQAVRNYRNSLEELDSDALSRKLRDKRFDTTIKRAIDNEQPLSQRQIQRMTDRYREKYIKYRSEVIARTESLRATSIGNDEAIKDMMRENAMEPDAMRKFWVFTRDARTRDNHRRIPSLNEKGVPMDQSFVTPDGPLRYPRDPDGSAKNTIQCRCGLRYRLNQEAA